MAELARIADLAQTNSRFTVLTGRRRVGKTELLEKAYNNRGSRYLYFLITNRSEKDLCGILQEEAAKVLQTPILGHAEHFSQLLEIIMNSTQAEPLTLVLDEFQEFDKINPAIFSEIQGVWDRLHKKSKINLIACGSVNRMMNKIFFDDSQPLYGRTTGSIHLDPFPVSLVKKILQTHSPGCSNRDLLALWVLTGGVARYVEFFMDNGSFTQEAMLKSVFSISSSYINEGKVILGEEFGRDHGIYFSILSAIAAGKTSYSEMFNVIGEDVGGQLTRLEKSYAFIRKIQPFGEKSSNKNCRYRLNDCFLRFWFRFVYKYQHLIEQKMFDELLALVTRDFEVFSGTALEWYFKAKFFEERRYTRIGGWWDRKGENEIDLVCENELTGSLDVYEVKRDSRRIDLAGLRRKVEAFQKKNPELSARDIRLQGLSLKDM